MFLPFSDQQSSISNKSFPLISTFLNLGSFSRSSLQARVPSPVLLKPNLLGLIYACRSLLFYLLFARPTVFIPGGASPAPTGAVWIFCRGGALPRPPIYFSALHLAFLSFMSSISSSAAVLVFSVSSAAAAAFSSSSFTVIFASVTESASLLIGSEYRRAS